MAASNILILQAVAMLSVAVLGQEAEHTPLLSNHGGICYKNEHCIERDQRCPRWSHKCECIAGYNYDRNLGCLPRRPNECADGWSKFVGHCYRHNDFIESYSYHAKHCKLQHEGAALASIHSLEEFNFIRELGLDSFIGLQGNQEKPREWKWGDGSPYDFKMWAKYEPNNRYQREDCVTLRPRDGQWQDVPCHHYYHGTCKYDPHKK